jgi:ubiquinone/menaquinone biosynthesis C-methylase UbiE
MFAGGASTVLLGILGVLLLPFGSAAQAPHTHHHSFKDASKWSAVFDDPKRDAWQKPHEVIQALGLAPDAVVADIGAGTGYFAARLAQRVPKGRVYAVDTEPDMVQHLTERAKREGLKNLSAVHATAADARLPEKIDLILFVDVYHHVGDRERYLRGLGASLKPGGRVAVIDFRMESPIGPPPSGRILPDRVQDEFRRAGYVLTTEHGFLPHQYFLVFQRAKP